MPPNDLSKIHKYKFTNTQKQYSQVSHMQIHKLKYTNTQIQLRSKLKIGPFKVYFSKLYYFEMYFCKVSPANASLKRCTLVIFAFVNFPLILFFRPQCICRWVSEGRTLYKWDPLPQCQWPNAQIGHRWSMVQTLMAKGCNWPLAIELSNGPMAIFT